MLSILRWIFFFGREWSLLPIPLISWDQLPTGNTHFINWNTVVLQPLSHVWLFVTPWTVAHQAFLSLTISHSLPDTVSFESLMLSKHVILSHLLLLLLSTFFNVFFNETALCLRWTNIGALFSASVLSMSLQYWFLLGVTVLISLQSKWLSQVLPSREVQNHQFFGVLISVQVFGKNKCGSLGLYCPSYALVF